MRNFLSRYLDSLVNAPAQPIYSPGRPGRSRYGYSFGERYWASITRTTLPPRKSLSRAREAFFLHTVYVAAAMVTSAVAVVLGVVAWLGSAPLPVTAILGAPAPSSPATPTPTAEFTNLYAGSVVSFAQQVAGRVADIPNGMSLWLVVRPRLAPGYWPQPGPLLFSPDGRFHALAYFGARAVTHKGETFILAIVEVPAADDPLFTYLQRQGSGFTVLPTGSSILVQITVTRS